MLPSSCPYTSDYSASEWPTRRIDDDGWPAATGSGRPGARAAGQANISGKISQGQVDQWIIWPRRKRSNYSSKFGQMNVLMTSKELTLEPNLVKVQRMLSHVPRRRMWTKSNWNVLIVGCCDEYGWALESRPSFSEWIKSNSMKFNFSNFSKFNFSKIFKNSFKCFRFLKKILKLNFILFF